MFPCKDDIHHEAVRLNFAEFPLFNLIAWFNLCKKGALSVAAHTHSHIALSGRGNHFLVAIDNLSQLTLFPSGCILCECVCTAYLNTKRCKMTYAELLDKHAGENEIRSFLVDGDTVPVTMRIPANLRDCAKEAAALRGMSFSAFMRACMIDELAKGGRK